MTNQAYIDQLDLYDRVEHEALRAIVASLCGGERLRVLDAGCGLGAAAVAFAAEGCQVVGVDRNPASLERARQSLALTDLTDAVDFQEGSMLELPFAEGSFDLAWCSLVLHHIADRPAAVRELRRVLRPGGRLAVREAGLPLQMLPFDLGLGEPGLQDRLRVAHNRWFAAAMRAELPDAAPYACGWPQLLRDGGFANLTARTWSVDALQPFDEAQAGFALFQLRRQLDRDAGGCPLGGGPLLHGDDRAVLRRLLDEADPAYLLKRSDLHLCFGISIYVGELTNH